MFAKSPFFLALLLLPIFTTACGSAVEIEEVKNFRLAVLDDNPEIHRTFQHLIDDFNDFAGLVALAYVSDPEKANSAILLTKGLRERDGKVGWGQWMTRTTTDGVSYSPGNKRHRTVVYTMRLEFDSNYITSRLAEWENKDFRYEKQKLFFHEVGHGMQMNHHSDPEDVMYESISGNKRFDPYFVRVRKFMD